MYRLSKEEFDYLKCKTKDDYRFVVETRAGSLVYDTFHSLDDALNMCFRLCFEYDIYMMEDIQIYDKVSRLVFKPDNLRMFIRDYGNIPLEEGEKVLDTV